MQANLMKFYEGSLKYSDTEELPIVKLIGLLKQAEAINKEIERRSKQNGL